MTDRLNMMKIRKYTVEQLKSLQLSRAKDLKRKVELVEKLYKISIDDRTHDDIDMQLDALLEMADATTDMARLRLAIKKKEELEQ